MQMLFDPNDFTFAIIFDCEAGALAGD